MVPAKRDLNNENQRRYQTSRNLTAISLGNLTVCFVFNDKNS